MDFKTATVLKRTLMAVCTRASGSVACVKGTVCASLFRTVSPPSLTTRCGPTPWPPCRPTNPSPTRTVSYWLYMIVLCAYVPIYWVRKFKSRTKSRDLFSRSKFIKRWKRREGLRDCCVFLTTLTSLKIHSRQHYANPKNRSALIFFSDYSSVSELPVVSLVSL